MIGDISLASFWISALVSAALRLKNIPEMTFNLAPVLSKATIIFSKSGFSWLLMLSISALASLIASSIAGKKCSVFIKSKGGVSKGVLKFSNNGFISNFFWLIFLLKYNNDIESGTVMVI